jgi:hypothetical protein
MRERDMKRLRAAVDFLHSRAVSSRPRTWRDLRDETNRAGEAVRQVFGWKPREIPERPQEYWEEKLREEGEIAEAIKGMTETEANGYIIDRFFGRKEEGKIGNKTQTATRPNGA